jgi:pimeloyl-ACP methyl ester carboxylesterase
MLAARLRSCARIWRAVAVALVWALVACGGEGQPGRRIGSELTFDAPAGRGSAGTVRLQGIERGSGPVGVVLAHMLGSSQSAWTDFATALVGRGYHVLTFDFRGHGLSGGERDPSLADLDLAAAVAKIRSLGASRVFVIGASVGGTAAVVVAAAERLEGVVAISPPAAIGGLDAAPAARRLDEPSLFVVGERDDPRYVDGARRLAAEAPGPKRLEVIPGTGAHGTDLLLDRRAGPRVERLLLNFLQAYGG